MVGNGNNDFNVCDLTDFIKRNTPSSSGAANVTSSRTAGHANAALVNNGSANLIDEHAKRALGDLTIGMADEESTRVRDRFLNTLDTAEGIANGNPAAVTPYLIVQIAALDAKCDFLERRQEELIKGACAEVIRATVQELMEAPDNKKIKTINVRINVQEQATGILQNSIKFMRNSMAEQARIINDIRRATGVTVSADGQGPSASQAGQQQEEANKKRKASSSLPSKVIPDTLEAFRALRSAITLGESVAGPSSSDGTKGANGHGPNADGALMDEGDEAF
ncbi:hypothetical protein QBC44DRAFT_354399 [Cladorrhinum sp. PSN332]|nr:hypothetical protein QBC44DRAFT_354399 [Cladorrhinum sp. PSN332]